METRLIIAYSLIALMVAFAILGAVAIHRNNARKQRRDQGHGDY